MTNENEEVLVEHWHLEVRDPASNTMKFYRVSLLHDGRTVTHWGRIGTQGQSKVSKCNNFDEARDIAMRQLYAKKSKGYEVVSEGRFYATSRYSIDGVMIASWYQQAQHRGELVHKKDEALAAFDAFIEEAQSFITVVQQDTEGDVLSAYTLLTDAWDEMTERYETAQVAMQIARMALKSHLADDTLVDV